MNAVWYSAASLAFSYISAAFVIFFLLLIARKHLSDQLMLSRLRNEIPAGDCAGSFRVLSASGRHLHAGQILPVPFEGTMGSSHSCDIVIPYRKVHLRSVFFWMEKDLLHMVPLHRDGFLADDVPIGAGDEAVLEDGAILCIGDLKLVLRLANRSAQSEADTGPYVTGARRSQARLGRGDGIGTPGKNKKKRSGKKPAQEED